MIPKIRKIKDHVHHEANIQAQIKAHETSETARDGL